MHPRGRLWAVLVPPDLGLAHRVPLSDELRPEEVVGAYDRREVAVELLLGLSVPREGRDQVRPACLNCKFDGRLARQLPRIPQEVLQSDSPLGLVPPALEDGPMRRGARAWQGLLHVKVIAIKQLYRTLHGPRAHIILPEELSHLLPCGQNLDLLWLEILRNNPIRDFDLDDLLGDPLLHHGGSVVELRDVFVLFEHPLFDVVRS
mmetsp:Transcript_94859/g.245579  ORF Transcript_94859/g.245579 Transcript_94859/m.245579 type:complete len:205 (-) Transcript_94859:115-729(-)